MKWEDYAAEFAWDGSWRDIHVLETSLIDWQLMLDFLRSSRYEFHCNFGDCESAAEIFSREYECKGYLSVNIGQLTLNCHFFAPDEFEFDLDPRDVKGEAQAKSIFDFMCQLGRTLNKEVILTPENTSGTLIFKFSPITQKVEYFPIKL